MPDWLMRLAGVRPMGSGGPTGGDIVSMEWVWRSVFGEGRTAAGVLVWVLTSVLVAMGVRWLYQRERKGGGKRGLMMGLRVGVVSGLLLLVLLRPGVRVGVEGEVRRQVIILQDTSASMTLRDPRIDPPDVKRAAMAMGRLDRTRGLEQDLPADLGSAQISRESIARGMLGSTDSGLIQKLGEVYDIRTFKFGRGLEGSADATAIGDTLREVLMRVRGQPVAGVLVVTDGASNTGASPLSVAESMMGGGGGGSAGRGGLRVFTYGVGLTRPKDLVAVSVDAPEVGFARDEVAATVKYRSTGFDAGAKGRLLLRLGGEVVDAREVELGGEIEWTERMGFIPEKSGEYQLTAELEQVPGEMVLENNRTSSRMRVVEGKMRVLYVEATPRWEFKYLQAILLRDRRVEAKFVLLEGSASLAEGERGVGGDEGGSPYLARLPSTREEWLKYDVVIFGDVDARVVTSQQYQWIREHVEKFGAGVVVMAGRARGVANWGGTELETMLPVEWAGMSGVMGAKGGGEQPEDEPVKLELTVAGQLSDMLRLAEGWEASAARWAELPSMNWVAMVLRARPGAEALVVDARPARDGRSGKMPVIAQQQVGMGSVLFVGTDNLWRIRRNRGDELHARLWGQIVQRMGLTHLLGESRRTKITLDKKTYAPGETIDITARLYTPDFQPVPGQVVRGELSGGGGKGGGIPVLLRAVPEQAGLFRGEVTAPAGGVYQLSVETDPQTKVPVSVEEQKLELAETAMNEKLLRELAGATGGAFLREEDLYTLPDLLAKSGERVRSGYVAEVWSSPVVFGMLLAMLGIEWWLRKRAVMK